MLRRPIEVASQLGQIDPPDVHTTSMATESQAEVVHLAEKHSGIGPKWLKLDDRGKRLFAARGGDLATVSTEPAGADRRAHFTMSRRQSAVAPRVSELRLSIEG